eukprot:765337-Hanusia_phi.AAC.1
MNYDTLHCSASELGSTVSDVESFSSRCSSGIADSEVIISSSSSTSSPMVPRCIIVRSNSNEAKSLYRGKVGIDGLAVSDGVPKLVSQDLSKRQSLSITRLLS